MNRSAAGSQLQIFETYRQTVWHLPVSHLHIRQVAAVPSGGWPPSVGCIQENPSNCLSQKQKRQLDAVTHPVAFLHCRSSSSKYRTARTAPSIDAHARTFGYTRVSYNAQHPGKTVAGVAGREPEYVNYSRAGVAALPRRQYSL